MIVANRKLDFATVGRAAQGRWHGIFTSSGVGPEYQRSQHGPCLHCGGKDGFRVDDKNGRGTFYCNRAQLSGDGFDLLVHVHGWSHLEALHYVATQLGLTAGNLPAPATRIALAPVDAVHGEAKIKSERQKLIKIISESTPILNSSRNIPFQYLAGRSLQFTGDPRSARCHAALAYYHHMYDRPASLGKFSAMVAPVLSLAGDLVGIHRTYLSSDGNKATIAHPQTGELLPVKKLQTVSPSATSGAAIRLYEATDRIAIAEGIETAIAAHHLFGLPAWAAISASGMEKIRLPESIKNVLIAADNDVSGVGQAAAQILAKRLRAEGRIVEIKCPTEPGTDFADVVKNQIKGEI